jgi:hypothetical protein
MSIPESADTEHSQAVVSVEPLALPIESTPAAAGVPRTRIFNAIKNKELTARKAGKSTIIELPELRRWIRSLPTRGRMPDATAAA